MALSTASGETLEWREMVINKIWSSGISILVVFVSLFFTLAVEPVDYRFFLN